MQIFGAIKISRYVGSLLSNTYGVVSVEDSQYEDTKEYYDYISKMCELIHIVDIDEYLEAINNEHYTIFIVARYDAASGLSDSVKEKLHALGLQHNLTGKYMWSYSAVVSPEIGVEEKLIENEPAKLSGSIRNGNTFYTISSCGNLAGTTSSIVIDGREYCKNLRGLNFVIYDNYLMKVIDQATFGTGGESNVTS